MDSRRSGVMHNLKPVLKSRWNGGQGEGLVPPHSRGSVSSLKPRWLRRLQLEYETTATAFKFSSHSQFSPLQQARARGEAHEVEQ